MDEIEDRKAEAETTQEQIKLCRRSSNGRLQLMKERYCRLILVHVYSN